MVPMKGFKQGKNNGLQEAAFCSSELFNALLEPCAFDEERRIFSNLMEAECFIGPGTSYQSYEYLLIEL